MGGQRHHSLSPPQGLVNICWELGIGRFLPGCGHPLASFSGLKENWSLGEAGMSPAILWLCVSNQVSSSLETWLSYSEDY